MYAYRIAPLAKFNSSPFKLLYGREPHDMVIGKEIDSKILETEDEVLKKIDLLRNSLHDLVRNSCKREIERNEHKVKDNNILVGDIVMKRKELFEKINKLDDKWSGPYLVKKKFDSGGFEIEDMCGRLFRYNEKDLQLMLGSDVEDWENLKKGSVLQVDDCIPEIIL